MTSNVVAPDQAVHGASIEVRYKVTNLGSAPTNVSAWTDTVWLSRDKTRPNKGGNGGILLGTFQHDGRLAVNENYERIVNVTLPDDLDTGTYYITAWSDTYDVVLEDTLAINVNPDDPNEFDNNNYKARPIQILGKAKPVFDFALTSVEAPDAVAGNPLTVKWTVQNRGDRVEGTWFDSVWLSSTPDFSSPSNEQWFLGTVQRSGSLETGQSYSAEQTFNLAPSVQGAFVIVRTDSNGATTGPGSIVESDETNNQGSDAALVTRAPSDLRVTSVQSDAPNFSGEKTTVHWTVQNDGAAIWSGTRFWFDAVWISKDPTFIPSRATFLGAKAHSNATTLQSGANYTDELEVTLPDGSDGDYFVYVITDSAPGSFPPHVAAETEILSGSNAGAAGLYSRSVFEGTRNDNNVGQGTLQITYREPDLQITSLSVSNPAPNSGQTIQVTFTVANFGERATRVSNWQDGIYLSSDPSLDANDRPLGWVNHTSAEGVLAANGSYTRTVSVRLPDSINGNFFLIVKADDNLYGSADTGPGAATGALQLGTDAVKEFRDEGNNQRNLPSSSTFPIRYPTAAPAIRRPTRGAGATSSTCLATSCST